MAKKDFASITKNDVKKVIKSIEAELFATREIAARVMTNRAINLLDESVKQTPVDTGALRASGFVRVNGKNVARGKKNKKEGKIRVFKKMPNMEKMSTKDDLAVEVGFDTPYAWDQHENMGYKHSKGCKAKYLEDPFRANKEDIEARIHTAIQQHIQ